MNQTRISKSEYLISRNKFNTSVKRTKRDHWNTFLEKEDSKAIFKAFQYTSPRKFERLPSIQNIPNLPDLSLNYFNSTELANSQNPENLNLVDLKLNSPNSTDLRLNPSDLRSNLTNSSDLATDFESKTNSLRTILFPKLPITTVSHYDNYINKSWKWSNLSKFELFKAYSGAIKDKTPRPDNINQPIIQYVYNAISRVFQLLYNQLMNIGYHPICWK